MNDCITDFTQTTAFPEEAWAPSVKMEEERCRHSCTFLNEEAAKAKVLSKGSSLTSQSGTTDPESNNDFMLWMPLIITTLWAKAA